MKPYTHRCRPSILQSLANPEGASQSNHSALQQYLSASDRLSRLRYLEDPSGREVFDQVEELAQRGGLVSGKIEGGGMARNI